MAERDDKKNTDLWKQKQEEKKKKKEAEAQGEAQPSKAEKKKEKKKDEKKVEKQEQQKTKVTKEDHKNPKQQETLQPSVSKRSDAKQPDEPCIGSVFKTLTKIDNLLSSKDRASRIYQEQLITKYMDQYLSESDIVLYVGQQPRIQRHQQVYVQGLNNCPDAELLCRYSDLSYFLESSVTKIFIEAEYIFSNGSILAKQGSLSIALMASFYNIPVIAIGGSWTYNGWAPVNFEALEEKYGSDILKKLDWIQDKHLQGAIAEVGVINPRQVSIYPGIIYKQLQLLSIEW